LYEKVKNNYFLLIKQRPMGVSGRKKGQKKRGVSRVFYVNFLQNEALSVGINESLHKYV